MNITTKYSLGETVWAIRQDFFQRIVRCVACENTGIIKINDEEFTCPKCHGDAKHPVGAGRKHFVFESGEVGNVRFETTAGKWAASNSNYDWEEGEHKDEIEIKYMLSCTGIGFGTLWDEESLFPSREAAQAYCDSKNSSLLPDEA